MEHAEVALQRRIRVLFIDHTAKLGGGELALAALIRHLDSGLIEHSVLLLEAGPLVEMLRSFTSVAIEPLSGELREARKDQLVSSKRETLRKSVELLRYAWRLSRTIKRSKVDLVHTNSLKSDILGGLASRLAGVRVVWHVRDRIEADYLPGRVVKIFRRLARMIPHAIIANSRATLDTLQLSPNDQAPTRTPWKRLSRVVHDGFDFSMVSEMPVRTDFTIRVGLIGRISPWKGQDVFLRAAAIVHHAFPQVRFQIIGSAMFGEEEYEKAIRKLCKELQLVDSVDFVGFISDIHSEIAKLDLVVHESTIGEPFGQVVIEGMAARKAVIATRGGGVLEIVLDGDTGILVPMNDHTAMATAILRLLSDPEERVAMGDRGFQRVVDCFRIEKTAAGVARFYQDLDTPDF